MLRQGLLLTAVGLEIGLVFALGLGRFAARILYGISGSDLVTFAVVSVILLGTAAIAVVIPALGAACVEPTPALLYE